MRLAAAVAKAAVVLRCEAVSFDYFPTFRKIVLPSASRGKYSRKFSDSLTLEDEGATFLENVGN